MTNPVAVLFVLAILVLIVAAAIQHYRKVTSQPRIPRMTFVPMLFEMHQKRDKENKPSELVLQFRTGRAEHSKAYPSGVVEELDAGYRLLRIRFPNRDSVWQFLEDQGDEYTAPALFTEVEEPKPILRLPSRIPRQDP